MEIYLRHGIGKKKGLTPFLRGESARDWSGETACPKADRQELHIVVYTLDSQ